MIKLTLIILALAGLLTGVFLAVNPALAIEIQRRFYVMINWQIEPISVGKEMRNTRIMGVILILASIAAFIYAVLNR